MGTQVRLNNHALLRGELFALIFLLPVMLFGGQLAADARAGTGAGTPAPGGSALFTAGGSLAVSYLGPLNQITVSNPVVTANAVAGAYAFQGATLQLAGVNRDYPWDATFYFFGCSLSPAGAVSCPTSGLPVARYTATVSVSDTNGGIADATGNFDVTCDGTEPPLSLSQTNAYWQTLSDYQNRILSVDFFISNPSINAAHDVTVVGAPSTNAVMLTNPLPQPASIPAGADFNFTLRYIVPAGIASFNTTIYATAQDMCGARFSYPAPFPGS